MPAAPKLIATSPLPSSDLSEPKASSSVRPDDAREDFLGRVAVAVQQQGLVALVLSKPHGAEVDLVNVHVRRIVLRGQDELCFVYRYKTRDVTKNLPTDPGLRLIDDLLGAGFRHAHLRTPSHELSLLIGKRGQAKLLVRAVQGAVPEPSLEHNREKHRWLSLERPFLTELGVTDARHRLIPAMSRKWRQINKFLEVFDGAWADSGLPRRQGVQIVDFGSGKGYLTFAIHDYLRGVLGEPVQVRGVELRGDMVQLCSAAADRLGLEGLSFEQGDVRRCDAGNIDVMIALHACDTATDHAIELGVRASAAIIMCAPCCHKEVRPQLLSPHPMRAILQHGVHLGQEADMVTDALRALLLEACGYATQVFEFVSLEHTSKNKMILAVKRALPGPAAPLLAQVDEVKRFYGIREQCLERLLRERLSAAAAPPEPAGRRPTAC